MCKLSIITVNLNNADGLRKTIESVVSQTFTDFEYILIDGGSTDGSVEVIKQYADKITYWVSEPDKGIYNAMNKGILQARGEYLFFLNSDDAFANINVLESIFKESICSDIITGNLIKVFPDGKSLLDKGLGFKTNGKPRLFDLVLHNFNHQSTFIKRSLFDKFGHYNEDYKIVADWLFFLQTVGIESSTVCYVDVNVALFKMGGYSYLNRDIWNKERERGIEEILPKYIIDDYKYFRELALKNSKYNYVLEYKFTYFIARVVNKTIRIIHKVLKYNG